MCCTQYSFCITVSPMPQEKLFKTKEQKRSKPRSYKPSYEAEQLLLRANRITKKNFNKIIDSCVILALWPRKSKNRCPVRDVYNRAA